jgi:hypothetical protein
VTAAICRERREAWEAMPSGERGAVANRQRVLGIATPLCLPCTGCHVAAGEGCRAVLETAERIAATLVASGVLTSAVAYAAEIGAAEAQRQIRAALLAEAARIEADVRGKAGAFRADHDARSGALRAFASRIGWRLVSARMLDGDAEPRESLPARVARLRKEVLAIEGLFGNRRQRQILRDKRDEAEAELAAREEKGAVEG